MNKNFKPLKLFLILMILILVSVIVLRLSESFSHSKIKINAHDSKSPLISQINCNEDFKFPSQWVVDNIEIYQNINEDGVPYVTCTYIGFDKASVNKNALFIFRYGISDSVSKFSSKIYEDANFSREFQLNFTSQSEASFSGCIEESSGSTSCVINLLYENNFIFYRLILKFDDYKSDDIEFIINNKIKDVEKNTLNK